MRHFRNQSRTVGSATPSADSISRNDNPELYPASDGQATVDATTRLGFAVQGLDGVVRALETAGVQIVRPSTESDWGRRAVVLDPDARSIELYQA